MLLFRGTERREGAEQGVEGTQDVAWEGVQGEKNRAVRGREGFAHVIAPFPHSLSKGFCDNDVSVILGTRFMHLQYCHLRIANAVICVKFT